MDVSKIPSIIQKHQQAAAQEIAALGFNGFAASVPAPRRAPAKVAKKTAKTAAKTTAKKITRTAKKPARKVGEKRDPAVLEKLVQTLHDYIKSNPGQRIEAIAAGLGGVATKDLNLPIKKLRRAGSLVSEGNKRATTYTIAA